MLRSWPLPLAIAALLAVPASAADESVQARPDNTFDPATVEIDPGDTVTFSNAGGFHNVRWDDGAVEEQPADPSPAPWSFERTFDAPGVHRYYCELHGGEGGAGMSGQVLVRDESGEVPAPPGLELRTRRKQSLERVLKGIRLGARCSGGCTVRLRVLDGRRTAGGKRVELERGAPLERHKVKLKKKARKRLAKRTKPFRLVLAANAASAGGEETLERKIKVVP